MTAPRNPPQDARAHLPTAASGQRRGIHDVHDLKLRCEVVKTEARQRCWVWGGLVVRRRPSANLSGHGVVHGQRIVAIVMGRDQERQPHQRWSALCGDALCMAPHHLQLSESHAAAHKTAAAAGRLKRNAGQRATISRAHTVRGTARPAWMVQWALDSDQSSRDVAHALGVDSSTVRLWRSGQLSHGASPFGQLVRAALAGAR